MLLTTYHFGGGLTPFSQVASNTDPEECRPAVLEENTIEIQSEVEMGLEGRDVILKETRSERQIQRNSEGHRLK